MEQDHLTLPMTHTALCSQNNPRKVSVDIFSMWISTYFLKLDILLRIVINTLIMIFTPRFIAEYVVADHISVVVNSEIAPAVNLIHDTDTMAGVQTFFKFWTKCKNFEV